MMSGLTFGPPVQPITSTRPLVYRTNVASPFFMGAYVCDPNATPPPKSFSLKPLLNVATSFERSRGGTSSGPREGRLTLGSWIPGYNHVVVRVWSIQATPTTSRG